MPSRVLFLLLPQYMNRLYEQQRNAVGITHRCLLWDLAVFRVEGGLSTHEDSSCRGKEEIVATVVLWIWSDIPRIDSLWAEGCSRFKRVENGCSHSQWVPQVSIKIMDALQDGVG